MKLHATMEQEHSSIPPESLLASVYQPFIFRKYQREDLARAAIMNGAIIGWDPGLGKTMAIFALPFLKKSRYTLIVAPAGLHEQIIDEGKTKFKVQVQVIKSQKQALELIRNGILPNNQTADPLLEKSEANNLSVEALAKSDQPPKFFITAYNWLGQNAADEWQSCPDSTLAARLTEINRHISSLPLITDHSSLETSAAWQLGIGHEKDGIRCVFTPSLASILANTFDCVIADEAVRVKSGDAKQAQGILRMAPKSRYLLTGTPIKNKLPDLFFLASWVAGHTEEPTARWPYGNTLSARDEFSKDFGVMEENETRNEIDRARGIYKRNIRTTAKICNVHRLWKILAAVTIRRSKDNIEGTDLVRKTIVPVNVMPGTAQLATYRFQLENPEKKDTALATIGCQLQRLRQAALCPTSPSLARIDLPLSRSQTDYTPKLAAILSLSIDLLSKGEQVVIFSPFQSFSETLLRMFADAAVPALSLDGKTSPTKRGSLVKKFKDGTYPILLAGIDSMGEGHSLDNASHLILPSLSWAFDCNAQAVERVHRLTSKKDVTIYAMVTTGTIDERLTSLWQEKGDSSSLALDGRLNERDTEELDLGKLLNDAIQDFNPAAQSIPESEIETQWKLSQRQALTNAYKTYQIIKPPIKTEKLSTRSTRSTRNEKSVILPSRVTILSQPKRTTTPPLAKNFAFPSDFF